MIRVRRPSPEIYVTPFGTHVVSCGEDFALCGSPIARGYPTFEFEPGSDFGSHPADCRRCSFVVWGAP